PQLRPKKTKRHSGRWLFGLIVIAAVGFFWLKGGDSLPSIIKTEPPQKIRIEGRYLFSGTVVWARNMQEWSKNPDGSTNYAYPFSGLNTFDRNKYDAWLADLECPVMDENFSIAKQTTVTAFNCRPEFLPEAAKYFTFFNLANNHTRDFNGQAALDETREHLKTSGIQYFGDFEPGKTDNICEVVGLPVKVVSKQGGTESSTTATLPAAFCAWHYFFRLPQPGEIEAMKKYVEAMPTFAFMQAGIEYRASPDEYQKTMARKIADLKPSFVIVNSAHWVQNGEVYKGVPILYSTGNFIFDQQTNNEVTRSASLDAAMTIDYSDDLQKWLDLGESCKTYHDDCFTKIKAQHLVKPTLKLRYDLVAGDDSNKLTKKADASVQAAVEQRVGWPAMKAALGQ
ncbi:MAG TPA: CapA family protein, partial [Candidatus Saccharimonadales bacterium]|nr:CapA family protein [Candidatus Saccharimonadales bacterium]